MERKVRISRFGHLDSFNTLFVTSSAYTIDRLLGYSWTWYTTRSYRNDRNKQESQGVMQGGADAPGTLILQEPSARTNFQGQIVRKEGFPAPQDVLTLISTMYLKSIKPSTPEEF